MSLFLQLGIGLLMNVIGGMQRQSQMQKFKDMQQQSMQNMQNFKFQGQQAMSQIYEQPNALPQLDFETPPFPQKSAQNFQDMQLEQLAQKENYINKFKADLYDMKGNYFKGNHYEFKDGSPVIKDSGENSAQKTDRLKYEDTLKQDMTQKHLDSKQKFLTQEKQNMLSYLNSNADKLTSPIIQGEIQQRLLETQKKALKLDRQQDVEISKIGLPTAEMVSFLETNLEKFHQMEDEQLEVQQNSQEGKVLQKYQDDLANALSIKKEEIKDIIAEQDLLQQPAYRTTPDLASALPPHLFNALSSDLEIYDLA